MTDDDRVLQERLAALEAEVKADADAQRARKEAALVKVRAEREKQQAERDDLRRRQAALVTKKKEPLVRGDQGPPEDSRAPTEPGVDRADDVAAMRRELDELKQALRESLPKSRRKRKS